MVTRLEFGRSRFRIPTGPNDIYLFQKVQTDSVVHPAFYSMGIWFISRGNVAGELC